VVPVPLLLLRYQARLGLSHGELIYAQHILARKWGADWPYVAVGEVATAAGVHITIARRWKAGLLAKGLLATTARGRPGGGRLADLHDLSGLFARLEALMLQEELAEARAARQEALPRPRYHGGLPPSHSYPQRPRADTRALRRARALGLTRAKTLGLGERKRSVQSERRRSVKKNRLTQLR